jgi:hypothetical protein
MSTRWRGIRRIVACVLLPSHLVACMSWKTQDATPQQLVSEEEPSRIRVTLTDGTQVVLTEPTVSGDTLWGLEDGERTGIPEPEIAEVALRRADGTTTVIALGVGVVVAAGVWYLAACEGDLSCNPP